CCPRSGAAGRHSPTTAMPTEAPLRAAPLTVSVLVLAGLALSGCATATTAAVPSPTPDGPVTVDNCGTSVTFDAAPERVVTIKSTSTEMLLALGLGDRIVGTAFQDGPVPDKWANEAEDIPVLADRVPSEEVVLE